MIVPNPHENYPPRWAEYRSAASVIGICSAFTRAPDVNRFGARYRLAKACEVRLAGYSAGTAAGYDALVKVALSWSAFESLLQAIGLGKHGVAAVSARHDFSDVFNAMRSAGNVLPFFKFVSLELDSKGQRTEVDNFIAGRTCCGLKLAKAVRHIFFHGTLTPNARRSEASEVAVACNALAGGVVRVMDAEFAAAVQVLIDAAHEAFPPHNGPDDFDMPF
jgi:hypothetical protein